MAYGLLRSGVMATPDLASSGSDAWERVAGVPASSSIVGGPGHPDDANRMPYNVDRSRGRIVTTDTTGITPAGGSAASVLDSWRDVFNWQGSPIPWLLLLSLVMLGLMQFRVQTRVGRRKASLAVG